MSDGTWPVMGRHRLPSDRLHPAGDRVLRRHSNHRRQTPSLGQQARSFRHPMPSDIWRWWAWADLNGRPHAYQACALTS
jgi:hypothetical protein